MDITAFPSVPPSFRTSEFTRFAIQHAKTLDTRDDVLCYIVPHIAQVDDTLVHELVQTFGCEVLRCIAQELIPPTEWVDLVHVALESRTFRNEQAVREILGRPHFTEERYDVFCRIAVKSRPDAIHHMTNLNLIWETALREFSSKRESPEEPPENTTSIITFGDKSLSTLFWDLYAHFKGTVSDADDADDADDAEKQKMRSTMAFRTDPLVHELCARLGPHAFSTNFNGATLYRMNRISNVLLPFAKIQDEWDCDVVKVDKIAALLSLIQEYESKTTGLRERRVELESAIQQWPR